MREEEVERMDAQAVLDRLGALKDAATVERVYGEAHTVGDRTVIPVAEVKTGLGFGFGSGKREDSENQPEGEGGGGGGGVMARPVGVIEVSPEGTQFIPIKSHSSTLSLLVIGMALGLMMAAFGGKCSMRNNG